MGFSDPLSLSPERRQVKEAERKDQRDDERGENITVCVVDFTETNHESNTRNWCKERANLPQSSIRPSDKKKTL